MRLRHFLATTLRVAAALCLLGQPVAAEQTPERPTIALVLSGGGAAGVAHVGVIKELERLGIRPDIITGTSMGAVVGGLYASGFTPADLERAVTEIDWTRILDDASERDLIQLQRRESRLDPFTLATELPIGLGTDGPTVAAGLVDGVKLTLILRQLTFHADGVTDFDELPIRFRAVATDLVTAQPVVLGEGDLSTALRASMSIPGFFPPVKLGDKVLVDGGVTNNLPIDVARDMGADVVIASFIPPAKANPDDLDSLTGALGQTMAIFIHSRSRSLISTLSVDDVLLTPPVEAVGMLAFDEAPDTITAGIAAVRAQEAALLRLAAGRPPLEARPSIGDTASAGVEYDRIVVEYDGLLSPEIILRRLGLPASGVATAREIERAVRRVYGLDLFENVTYRLERREGATGSERVLVIRATRGVQGLLQPRIGLAADNFFGGESAYTLSVGATLPELNAMGGRLDIDLLIGENEGGRLKFEQPLDADLEFFVVPEVLYLRQHGTLYTRLDSPDADIDIDTFEVNVSAIWQPVGWAAFGPIATYRHRTATLETGSIPGFDAREVDDDRILLGGVLNIDTLDDVDLPTAGYQAGLQIGFDAIDDERLGEVEFDALSAYSFGRHTFSPYVFLQGEIDGDGFSPNFIGGFPQLPGFDDNELVGEVVGVAGFRYYRRTDFIPFFGSDAFVGGGLAYGGAYGDWGELTDRDGGFVSSSVFTGVETRLGPAILSFGAAEQGQFSATLSLGRRF